MTTSNYERDRPFPGSWEDAVIESYELLDVLGRACDWSELQAHGYNRGHTTLVNIVQAKLRTVMQEMADYHILYGKKDPANRS